MQKTGDKSFFENPWSLLDLPATEKIQHKFLFKTCARFKNLKNAIILFYVCKQRALTIDTPSLSIVMNLLSCDFALQTQLTQKLCDFQEIPESHKSSPFWQLSIYDFVRKILHEAREEQKEPKEPKEPKEQKEALYTLAIRFFAETMNDYEKAKMIYVEMRCYQISGHNRTYIPLIRSSPDLSSLVEWHKNCIVNVGLPSIEFYEELFLKMSSLNDNKSTFLALFKEYTRFYQFITPKMAVTIRSILKLREDVVIGSDGLVYSGYQTPGMPEFKLESSDISYREKLQVAKHITKLNNAIGVSNSIAFNEFEAKVQSQAESLSWDVVIDGANVALYNNSEEFRVDRIISVIKWALSCNYKALVILHQARKKAGIQPLLDLISSYKTKVSIYWTPVHHNDDHFSLYAALTRDAYILTNDEMRDHANTLDNHDFQKWRERHQLFFTFKYKHAIKGESCEIRCPCKFSQIIQFDEMSCTIHAPIYDVEKHSPHYIENLHHITKWISFKC